MLRICRGPIEDMAAGLTLEGPVGECNRDQSGVLLFMEWMKCSGVMAWQYGRNNGVWKVSGQI